MTCGVIAFGADAAIFYGTVIPGRCEASNPESRDSGFDAIRRASRGPEGIAPE
jgi:hypothetical protein